MEIQKTKRTGRITVYDIKPVESGAGGKPSHSFQSTFYEQYREHYKNRAAALFEEISAQAPLFVDRADIDEFEKYRSLIGELLNEVVNNAYAINPEHILDTSGKRRIYMTIKIIDSKLENLARDLLDRNSNHIDCLRRVDERA